MVARSQACAVHGPVSPRNSDTPLIRRRDGTVLSLANLLATANELASRLPDRHYLVNISTTRQGFLTGLIAGWQRGQVTLMPPNRQPATLANLQESTGKFTLLLDSGQKQPDEHFISLEIPACGNRNQDSGAAVPELSADQLCIIAYTSGSTGESTPNLKPWHTLREGARINCTELLDGMNMSDQPGEALELLATVPSQHMYGFETAVMLPLFANIVLHDRQPFYPQDIADALIQMQGPRVLVSTPVHLRALLKSGIDLPPIARIISATAPMDLTLARTCEDTWNTELVDTYGCSEAGCIARRRQTRGDNWQLFDAFKLESNGDALLATADHLPEPVALPDQIEILDRSQFKLLGRNCDLVNIAGKRASLPAINRALMSVPGVEDGVVFLADPKADRLSALVVAHDLDEADLKRQLRQSIDPVMLPRPIVFIDRLPRNETGKLPRQALLDAWQQAREH